MTWQDLYNQIDQTFNLADLRELMFNLNIDFEHIAGQTKPEKIRELLFYCQRRNKTDHLIFELSTLRPNLVWELPEGAFDLNDGTVRPKFWKIIMTITFVSIFIFAIYLMLDPFDDKGNLSAEPEIMTTITSPTATLEPTQILANSASSTCNVIVSEPILEKKIIHTNQTTQVSIRINNPDNVRILFNWYATYGDLNPGLRTTAIESTYISPSDPTDDTIFVTIEADGCELIERSIKISIIKPSESPSSLVLPGEIATATIVPSITPTATPLPTEIPIITVTPTKLPSLLVESFEYYTESSLRENYFVNTYAGNEGAMRLVGVPYNQEGSVALAFDYKIINTEPNHYIGFEREFPAQDWSNYTLLCVWIQGDGTNRDIVVQFGEDAGQSWKRTYPLSLIGTGDYCIPITESNLNLANIGYYGIYIEGSTGPSSTMFFDNIRVTTD